MGSCACISDHTLRGKKISIKKLTKWFITKGASGTIWDTRRTERRAVCGFAVDCTAASLASQPSVVELVVALIKSMERSQAPTVCVAWTETALLVVKTSSSVEWTDVERSRLLHALSPRETDEEVPHAQSPAAAILATASMLDRMEMLSDYVIKHLLVVCNSDIFGAKPFVFGAWTYCRSRGIAVAATSIVETSMLPSGLLVAGRCADAPLVVAACLLGKTEALGTVKDTEKTVVPFGLRPEERLRPEEQWCMIEYEGPLLTFDVEAFWLDRLKAGDAQGLEVLLRLGIRIPAEKVVTLRPGRFYKSNRGRNTSRLAS